MDLYSEDLDYYSPHMTIPEFMDIYQAKTLYSVDLDDDEDDHRFLRFIIGSRSSSSHGYPGLSTRSPDRGLSENRARSLNSLNQQQDTERKSKSLQQSKKQREKAEKKRLKKQKRKERKLLEKLEKTDQDSDKTEGKEEEPQSDTEETKSVIHKTAALASAKDIAGSSSENDSSDEDTEAKDDSDEFEELDMTSSFVSKAALIAKKKMEPNPKTEKKEKKKSPVKVEPKKAPNKPNEDVKAGKEDPGRDSVAASRPSAEDNIKISNDLANLGNQFASSGDFSRAVKYFTDAIIYNPTEIKLFGNRALCFEKMHEYGKALADADLCLSLCPGWVKGLFRKGRALAGLKRYEEAAEAFRELLKVESSCTDAAQELMRVQTMQLIEYGYPLKQSTNALIIHGTVEKALEALSSLNLQPGAAQNGSPPPAQVANINGVSPVLSATNKHAALPLSHDAPKIPLSPKPPGLGHNMLNIRSQTKPVLNHNKFPNFKQQELFPVWLGNLFHPVTETIITNLFSKAGRVHSVKLLSERRCAFINYTKQEDCEEAIRCFNGFELNGTKIVVRYPDRIPPGMGISRSALKAQDLQDEYTGLNNGAHGRNAVGNRRPPWPQKPVPSTYKGNQKP